MDLLLKILITYYFIMFFICIHRLLNKESALKARHDAFKKHGFNKKSIRDGIYGILFGSILLYISSDYLYFKSYWKFMAVFTLIIRVGTIATISIRKPKWLESNVEPSKEWKAFFLMNFRNQRIDDVVFGSFLLIAWLKTFPIVQTSLIENNEQIITVTLFILRVLSLVLLAQISYFKRKELTDA